MEKTSLVLEGGGVRGIYTAGVLDYFLSQNLKVDTVYGVSAGALHGVNFIAGQKERSYRVATNYLKDKRYLGMYSLVHTGDIFGADFCYHIIPDELDLFDYQAFCENPTQMYAVVSNVETGEAEYVLCNDLRTDIEYIRASASLPVLSRIVTVNGKKYLDGGICDSIPLKKSQEMGHTKNIVIQTRVNGYQKQPDRMMPMVRRKYRHYPEFVKAADRRHLMYNGELEYINQEREKGNCFVIRPSHLIEVSRLEKNVEKIRSLYQLGMEDAKAQYEDLCIYLGQ